MELLTTKFSAYLNYETQQHTKFWSGPSTFKPLISSGETKNWWICVYEEIHKDRYIEKTLFIRTVYRPLYVLKEAFVDIVNSSTKWNSAEDARRFMFVQRTSSNSRTSHTTSRLKWNSIFDNNKKEEIK